MQKLMALGALVGAALIFGLPAQAADPIKIGLVLPYSGLYADYGKQIDNGVSLYLAQHGNTIAGRPVVLIRKDTTGPVADMAKRLSQELIVNDGVDVLAGYGFTPEALAVTSLVTEAKKPTVIMNAATSGIPEKSPYMVRFSMTLPQVTEPLGTWAAKNGIHKVYTMVSDYGPGLDAEAAFKRSFTAGGGEVIGGVHIPLNSPDFAGYLQRVKDSKPEAVFLFVPAGEQAVAFAKAFIDLGLASAGVKLMGSGDITDDDVLEAMGDPALGIITSHQYSYDHDSAMNHDYVKAYAAAYGKFRPNFMSVAGYDGMAAIAHAIEAQGGKIDPDKTMELLDHTSMESPRGPIAIDPATHDIVQTIYIRRVQKVDGQLVNHEFDQIAAVKDPGR
jgi:branched-chain amino acid transport system substrate-binding protein